MDFGNSVLVKRVKSEARKIEDHRRKLLDRG